MYFLTTLKIQHNDSEQNQILLNNYNANPEYKMRHIHSDMPTDFWSNYAKTLVELATERRLIFRAKFANLTEQVVEVLNVWDSRKTFENMFDQCNGNLLLESFARKSFTISLVKKNITQDEFKSLDQWVRTQKNPQVVFNKLNSNEQSLLGT